MVNLLKGVIRIPIWVPIPRRQFSTFSPFQSLVKQATSVESISSASTTESIPDKIYRYADITGFLTRWNSRKAWILDLEPSSRLGVTQVTEHERKLSIFMVANSFILFILSLYYWYHAQLHFPIKPPTPAQPDYPNLNMKRNDFVWHSKIPFVFPRDRCKECRWLETNCKRECFDNLKAQGHKFWVNGADGPLTKPRFKLEPPHTHH